MVRPSYVFVLAVVACHPGVRRVSPVHRHTYTGLPKHGYLSAPPLRSVVEETQIEESQFEETWVDEPWVDETWAEEPWVEETLFEESQFETWVENDWNRYRITTMQLN